MALITDLPAASSLATTDLLIKDTGSATQKIAISDAYATASQPGLVSTGAQSFAGRKIFENSEVVVRQSSAGNGYVSFIDGSGNNSAYMRDRTSSSHRLDFLKRSYNSSDNSLLSTFETFALPNVDANRTGSADYEIITTKTGPTHTQIATNFTLTAWWNVVTIDFNGYTPSASTYTTLAAAYRPNYTAHGICRWYNGTNYYPALITIQSNGAVSGSYFNPNTGTASSISSGTLAGSVTFVAK